MSLGRPALLLLVPLALVALYLLERWRRRPLRLEVADLGLFELTPELEAESSARRRRVGLEWLLRALAVVMFGVAAADPSGPAGSPGRLVLDLVIDRGVTSGTREGGGGTRLDLHRERLGELLDALRSDDRVRLHLAPGPALASDLSPADARTRLAGVRPTGARAELDGLLAVLGGRAVATAGPPVFVASDRAVASRGAAFALSGTRQPNRGVLSLAQSPTGLCVTVASYGSPGPAEVVLSAAAPGGAVREARRRIELPEQGWAMASWSVADGFPPAALEVSARLTGSDALPTDDRAFAVRSPVARRRVGVLGAADPGVLRALRAVPGTDVVVLDGLPAAAGDLELLLLPSLPDAPPAVAVCVLPARPPEPAQEGGRLRGSEHAAFAHSLAALSRERLTVPAVGALPSGVRGAPLLLAGTRPFLVVQGEGRDLLAVATAPVPDDWTRSQSFPLFWAELLELAAPRAHAPLAAHVAGEPWPPLGLSLGPEPPLAVRRFTAADGRPLLGTVAAPADVAPPEPRSFMAEVAQLEARRPPAPRVSWAPALAALGLAAAFVAWRLSGRG